MSAAAHIATRPKSRKLTWPEPKKRGPRYTPRGQRDTILLREAGRSDEESYHQDPALALVAAQQALTNRAVPATIEVVRQPIGFGRPAVLYRIVRDEDGAVLTYPVDLED